jgi:mono/diheme cytochrome c family protein
MLKPFLHVSVVAIFAIAQANVPAALAQEAQKVPVKVTGESQAKAKKLYAMDCALCHGATGDGKTDVARDMELTMADWTDVKTLASSQNQDLFKIIRDGKGKMPPEEVGRAKDDDVWNLIVYIRSFGKVQPAAPAAAPPDATPAAPTAVTASPAPSGR